MSRHRVFYFAAHPIFPSAFLLLTIGLGPAFASDFMDLGVGARGIGLGRSYAALSRGAESLFWNPSGLGRDDRRLSATFSQARLYGLLDHQAVGASFSPIPGWAFALGSVRLSQASLEGLDASGNPSGSFEASDQLWILGASAPLAPGVSLGASVKKLDSEIGHVRSSQNLFDLGLSGRRAWAEFALTGRNLPVSGDAGADLASLHASIAVDLVDNFLFSLQGDHSKEEGTQFGLGAEIALGRSGGWSPSFRGGFRGVPGGSSNPLPAFHGGLGLRNGIVSIDYAFSPQAELGAAHRFSLGFAFGQREGDHGQDPHRGGDRSVGDVDWLGKFLD